MLVWTGEVLVLVHGHVLSTDRYGTNMVGGTIIDPRDGTQQPLPPAPLNGGEDNPVTQAVWTGTDVLVWNHRGAASWNPDTGKWWLHEGFPPGAGAAVWTGSRLKAWEVGVSYRPSDGDIITLATLPAIVVPASGSHAIGSPNYGSPNDGAPASGATFDGAAVWTPDGVVVHIPAPRPDEGVFPGPGQGARGQFWRLEMGGARWERLAASPWEQWRLDNQTGQYGAYTDDGWLGLGWDGARLVAVDSDANAAAYDPAQDEWTALPG